MISNNIVLITYDNIAKNSEPVSGGHSNIVGGGFANAIKK